MPDSPLKVNSVMSNPNPNPNPHPNPNPNPHPSPNPHPNPNPLKVNNVMMAGVNDDELLDFAALTVERPIHVRFIEYMPFDGNRWKPSKMVPFNSMIQTLEGAHPGVERLTNDPHDVATSWRIPGALGTVSFISSMTQVRHT